MAGRGPNQNLNFDDFEDETRFIHYNGNKDETTGAGTLYGSDDQGGTWTLDLAQFTGDGDTLDPIVEFEVCNADLGVCVVGSMTIS